MADYFTQFSTEIDMPSKETATAAVELLAEIETILDKEDPDAWPEDLAAFKDIGIYWGPDVSAVADGERIYIHDASGTPNLEFVGAYAQVVLKRFMPTEAIGIEYACICSKNRPGGFGGGVILVTADSIEFRHSGELIDGWKKRHRAAQEVKTPNEKSHYLCCRCGGADVEISVPAFFKLNVDWEPSTIDFEAEALTYFCNTCEEDVSIRTPVGDIKTGRWSRRA